MKNLKWCVVSERFSSNSIHSTVDGWLTVCESKEEAIEEAKSEWKHLSTHDKKYALIVAGTCNVDESGDYAEREDGTIDADIYEIAWTSKEVSE